MIAPLALTFSLCLLLQYGQAALPQSVQPKLIEITSDVQAVGDCLTASHVRVLPAGTLIVDSGSTVTLHGTLEVLQGGTVRVGAGSTLVLMGDVSAGRYKIFDLQSGGSIQRHKEGVATVALPEWWGALPSAIETPDAVDCTAAIQAAIDFVGTYPDQNTRRTQVPTTVSFGRGFYRCEGYLTIVGDTALQGAGDTSTTLLHTPTFDQYQLNAPHRAFITVEIRRRTLNGLSVSSSGSAEFHDLRIIGDYKLGSSSDKLLPELPTSVTGIHLDNSAGIVVDNVGIIGFRDAALRISYVGPSSFEGLSCTSSGAGLRVEGKNPDLTNWAYWLPASESNELNPLGAAALPAQAPVMFDSVVCNKLDQTGSERYHYVAVASDGTVTHREVIPQDHAWLSAAVSCEGSPAGASCDAQHEVKGYAGALYVPEGAPKNDLCVYGQPKMWLNEIGVLQGGETPLPSLGSVLVGSETVVDMQCTSLGQYNTFECFCMTSSGRVLYAAWGHTPLLENESAWNEVKFGLPSDVADPSIGLAVCSLSDAYIDTETDPALPVQWDRGTQHIAAFSNASGDWRILHGYRPGWGIAEGTGPRKWYVECTPLPAEAPNPLPGTRPVIGTALLCIDPSEKKTWSEIIFLSYRTEADKLCVLRGTFDSVSNGAYDWAVEIIGQGEMESLLDPLCVSPQSGRFDLFLTDEAGHINHRTWTVATGWTSALVDLADHITLSDLGAGGEWQKTTETNLTAMRPGSCTVVEPTVTSAGPNRLDLFVLDDSGRIFRRRFDNRWYDWEPFQGTHPIEDQSHIATRIDSVGGHGAEILWVLTQESSGAVMRTAHWNNSISTALGFSDVRFADNQVGADLSDGQQITVARGTIEGNSGVGSKVDYASLVTFSNCWFENNRGHCIQAGADGLVRGLAVTQPQVVGHGYTEPRSVFWLDKIISANLELITVANPFDCHLSTTPNSYGVLFRDVAAGSPLLLDPGYWCYGFGHGWISGNPPQPCTCETYGSEWSLCSRYPYCTWQSCVGGIDLVPTLLRLTEAGKFEVRVQNQGCYTSPGFTVQLTGPNLPTERKIPFLPPGQIANMILVQSAPQGQAQYEVEVEVDVLGEVPECNEDNNKLTLKVGGTTTASVPPSLTLSLAVADDTSCGKSPDGSIDLTVTGGTAPFSFIWTNGATTEDLTGVPGGTYGVTVTDATGCMMASGTTTVGPLPLTVSFQTTDASCNGSFNGSITPTVTGGKAPYTFNWSNPVPGGSIANPTAKALNSVGAGTYQVVVTDANGCTVTGQATISEPAPLTLSLSAMDASCNGSSDGSVDLTITGGTPPYSYNWDSGETTEDLRAISAGSYRVEVTDANNCSAKASAIVSEPSALSLSLTPKNAGCYGTSDGSIDLAVSGGTPPYSYSWTSGETTQDLSAISAGTYMVNVTDANGCSAMASAIVSQPASLELILTPRDVQKRGANDGAIDLTVIGGTPKYRFRWSNGATSEDLTDVPADTYIVIVTDANECAVQGEVVVGEPPAEWHWIPGVVGVVEDMNAIDRSRGATGDDWDWSLRLPIMYKGWGLDFVLAAGAETWVHFPIMLPEGQQVRFLKVAVWTEKGGAVVDARVSSRPNISAPIIRDFDGIDWSGGPVIVTLDLEQYYTFSYGLVLALKVKDYGDPVEDTSGSQFRFFAVGVEM